METKQLKCDCKDCNLPASTPQATGEKNTPVNRPEIRVNTKEVVGQPLACPLKEPLKPDQQPICGDKCLEPNPNQQIITEIEGLISQVMENLDKYEITSEAEVWLHSQLFGKIHQFKTTLRELKQVFIGVNNDISES